MGVRVSSHMICGKRVILIGNATRASKAMYLAYLEVCFGNGTRSKPHCFIHRYDGIGWALEDLR